MYLYLKTLENIVLFCLCVGFFVYGLSFFFPFGRWFDEFCLAVSLAITAFFGLPWTQFAVVVLIYLWFRNRQHMLRLTKVHDDLVQETKFLKVGQKGSEEKHHEQFSSCHGQLEKVREKLSSHSAELKKINGVLSSVPEVQARNAVQDAVANVMKTGR